MAKVNAEDKGEGQRAAEENDVHAYPTALIYNGDGKVVGKVVGYLKVGQMEAALNKIAKQANK